MKRCIFGVLFLFCLAVCYGQQNIDEYISYLGQPVPKDFERINRTMYKDNTGYIVLFVENNLVKICSIGGAFDYTHEASNWLAFYYSYFEDNKWEYTKASDSDIYEKNGTYAMIARPRERADGSIGSMIMLINDPEWFANNYRNIR